MGKVFEENAKIFSDFITSHYKDLDPNETELLELLEKLAKEYKCDTIAEKLHKIRLSRKNKTPKK